MISPQLVSRKFGVGFGERLNGGGVSRSCRKLCSMGWGAFFCQCGQAVRPGVDEPLCVHCLIDLGAPGGVLFIFYTAHPLHKAYATRRNTMHTMKQSLIPLFGAAVLSLVLWTAPGQAATSAADEKGETTSAMDEAINKDAGAPVAATVDGQETVTVTADRAFVLIAGEAEKGNVDAMLNVGSFYERGFGIGRNFGKAKEWYTKAADAGSATGIYNVGVCHEIGMGTEVNVAKAIEYYDKADKAGFAPAAFKLFTMYAAGTGMPKDEAKAAQFLKKASDAGDANAMGVYGVSLLYGQNGVKKDGAAAIKTLQKSAETGNLESAKNLGVVFRDGIETKANPSEALKWYLIAKKAGYPEQAIDGVIQDLQQKVGQKQGSAMEKQAEEWVAQRQKEQAQ